MRGEPRVDNGEKNLPGRVNSKHKGPNMIGKFYKQQEVLLLGWRKSTEKGLDILGPSRSQELWLFF